MNRKFVRFALLSISLHSMAETALETPSSPSVCKAPAMITTSASEPERKAFNAAVDAYTDCANGVIKAEKKIIQEAQAKAQAAIDEYNAFGKALDAFKSEDQKAHEKKKDK